MPSRARSPTFFPWIKVGVLDRDGIDGQQTSGITAYHVIPGKSDDTLDVVALVEMDGQPRGHPTHDRAHHRTPARARSRSPIGEKTGAVEDDKVPSFQR